MGKTIRMGIGTAALTALVVFCASAVALGETITFGGTITEVVDTPPAPFDQAAVGSTWTLSYAFDPTTSDVDGSATAGQYQNAVTSMTLTIG